MAKPQTKSDEDDGAFEVTVRQTTIPVYRLKRGEYQFRVYIGGKPERHTRASREAITKIATEIATKIDNGKAQAGAVTAADLQSLIHAQRQLTVDDPPVHLIVEDWKRLKLAAPGATTDELAALWRRSRMRSRGAAQTPADSLVSAVKEQFLVSLHHAATASGSSRNLEGFRPDLKRFAEKFGNRSMVDVYADDIEKWLRGLGCGSRRQDNILGELITFFRYARDKGHLPDDIRTEPEKVPKLDKGGGDISYYRPAELKKFLTHVEERWLPFLVIQAFAGVRTSEIGRLSWSDFDWVERSIYVPASKAKKVRRRRRVPIERNLFAWLLPWQHASGRLYDLKDPDGAWGKYTKKLAEKAKIPWRNNNLRHSRATYWMATHENFGQVAAWLGHSEPKLKSNYDGVGSMKEAKIWDSIMPEGAKHEEESNIIAMTPQLL